MTKHSVLTGATAVRMLADVRDRIRQNPALPRHRRQDMVSALNRVAAVLESDLADIPADPRLLRSRLAEATPARFGIGRARWNNIRSLINVAFTDVVPNYASRGCKSLSPDWQSLVAKMKEKFQIVRIVSFMYSCSEKEISPGEVNQPTFEAFEEALNNSLRRNAATTYRETVAEWNRAARTIADWPSFLAVRPSRRRTWTYPWSEFPKLAAKKKPWLDRLGNPDPLADLPFKPLRPATLKMRDQMLREAASALKLQGWDPDTFCEIRQFGTLPAFKAVLREMIRQHGGTPGRQIEHVAWMLKAIARHVTHAPQAELDEMAAIIRRLRTQRSGMAAKYRSRLKPFDDRETVRQFLNLPQILRQEAAKAKSARKAASLIEMALAIELLLMAPMRIKNLVALDIEQHIIRTSGGRRVWITIPPDQVKNEMNLDYPLPDESVALLDLFLHHHRRHLMNGPTTALFPGRKAGFRDRVGFAKKVTQTIKNYTGLTVNVHLFRHAGGKFYLDDHPGGYEVVRRVLGHRSLGVTTSFYTGMETEAAIRHYQASILKRRHPGDGA